MNRIAISVEFDKAYLFQAQTTVLSIRENVPLDTRLVIFCQHYRGDTISSDDIYSLKRFLGPDDKLFPIIIDSGLSSIHGRWSPIVYLRLLLLYFLPSDILHVLHIDCDVIVNGDITPLYNACCDSAICGTKDLVVQVKRRQSPLFDNNYVNAGVIVYNKRRILEKYPTQKQMEDVLANLEKYPMLDQDFINFEFSEKKIMPDDMYMRFATFALKYLPNEEKNYLSKKPVCIHYADYVKPWLSRGHCRYRTIFWKYGRKVYPRSYRARYLLGRFFSGPCSTAKAYLRLLAAKWRQILCHQKTLQ